MREQTQSYGPVDTAVIAKHLRVFSRILTEAKVPFWLEAGTALAAYRDGAIFPWEHDVDVATWMDHQEEIRVAIDLFRAHGWSVRVQKGFPYLDNIVQMTVPTGSDGRELFPNQFDLYVYRRVGDEALMRWIHQPTGFASGIQKKLIWYAKAFAMARGQKARFAGRIPSALRLFVFRTVLWTLVLTGRCRYHAHPKRFFEELKTISFYGVPFRIPKDTEAFLARRYGPGWNQADPEFNASGKWRSSLARPERALRLLPAPNIDPSWQSESASRFEQAMTLVQHAVRSAHPSAFMQDAVRVEGDRLVVGERSYELSNGLRLLSFGKAGSSMAEAFVRRVGAEHIRDGVVVAPSTDGSDLLRVSGITMMQSTHPFVSERSVEAGARVLAFADTCTAHDVVVCLVSGGGSALLASPVEGVNVEEKTAFIRLGMAHGIAERELNVVRQGLSRVKGGQLARRLAPARIVNIILSDERAHRVEANASGPTVPHRVEQSAQTILEKSGLWLQTPPNIRRALSGAKPLSASDLSDVDIHTQVIRGREIALAALESAVVREGFKSVHVCPTFFHEMTHGGVDEVASILGREIRAFAQTVKRGRHAFLAHGEVMIRADAGGRGGRCQHLSAAMIDELKTMPNFTFMVFATDGCDFMHGVHGAWISDETVGRLRALGIDHHDALARTATHDLHKALGTLLLGDYTGTNVNDLYLCIIDR